MSFQPVLLGGEWRARDPDAETIQAVAPAERATLPDAYPVSSLADVELALGAAQGAVRQLESLDRAPQALARFLERFAAGIEERATDLVAIAHRETALPAEPRLRSVELPRTANQLRQAAAAARERSWCLATIDTQSNIRSRYAPLPGPVVVFGPNNFPFAFNGAAGGDFAAAIAAGNPVIAKANPGHPGTTRLLAEIAFDALLAGPLPKAMVQLIYHLRPEDGLRLVAHPNVGATAFTGSRAAGLRLKEAADRAGKPIYLEMSSVNPVVVLPGALAERGDAIAGEFTASSLMGAGQFCTNPGLVLLLTGNASEDFLARVAGQFGGAQPATLLSERVPHMLAEAVDRLRSHGAALVAGGEEVAGPGYCFANTLLRVSGDDFLRSPEPLQNEAFGPAALFVFARDVSQLAAILDRLEGNLTGTIYSDTGGRDDGLYARIEPALRRKVGRLLNDKMPTGVAVSPAMVHGGPYPATGHPGFTAVGIPAAMRRFAALQGYDNVRPNRLPAELRDRNPTGLTWRLIDGTWTQRDI